MKKAIFLLLLFVISCSVIQAQIQDESANLEIQSVWGKAEILQKQEKYAEAEIELKNLVNKYPNHAGVLYVFGINQMKQKKADEAISAFKTAIEYEPKHSAAMFYLGITLMHQKKDYESAIPYLEKNLEMTAQDFKRKNILDKLGGHNQHLAEAYYGAKRFDEATKQYESLVAHNPIYFGYSYRLASCYFETDNLEAAEQMSRKLIELQPNNFNVWVILGNSLKKQNKLSEAEVAFQTARNLCSNCNFN